MAESMWDAALKGFEFGKEAGDRFTRRSASKKERALRKKVNEDPQYADNEIARQRAYEEGVADLTRAARGRGIDLQSEFLTDYQQSRGRESSRRIGEQTLGLPGPGGAAPAGAPPAGAPPAPGAAPIAPPAGPMGRAAPNFAGAADTGAQFAYAGGDAGVGSQLAQQGRNIGIANKAMKADPITGQMGFDTATAAQGQTADLASQGNIPGAQQAQNVSTTALQMLGQKYFGMALQELSQEKPNKDRVEATLNEGFKAQPQLGYDRGTYDPETKKVTMWRGNEAMHEQLVGTAEDMDKLTQQFTQYSTDPGAYLNGLYQTQLADAASQKEEAKTGRGKVLDTMLKNIENYPKDQRGVMESALTAIGKETGGGGKGGGGFDVEKLDIDGPSTFKVGGKILTIQRVDENTKLPPGTKRVPGMLIVQDERGNTTTLEQEGMKAEVASKLMDVMTNGYKANLSQRKEDYADAQHMLENFYRGFGGNINVLPSRGGGERAGPGAAPPSDVKAIQQDYQDLGKQHGFEISSMERPVMKGVGAGERSQHPKGTAVDYSVKGKTKEEGDALIADLQSKGYQVVDERDGKTGTGPHIHAELPPGGLAGSPTSQPSAPSQPSPASPPSLAAVTPEPKPPMDRTPAQELADPETHKANAARASAAAKVVEKAGSTWNRWNDRMQEKYGPDANDMMTESERGTQEDLRTDLVSALAEADTATKLASGQAAGFRGQQAKQAAQAEQEALTAQFRSPEAAAAAPAQEPTPRQFRGPAPSQNFFAKYLQGFK